MPRKVRVPKLRQPVTALDPEVVIVALHGFRAKLPAGEIGDWLAPYDVPVDAWGAVWSEHAPFLRQEAARRGLPPCYRGPDGTLRFFAESEAWEAEHHAPLSHTDARPYAERGQR